MKDARKFWNKTAKRYAKSPVRNEQAYQKKLAMTRAYFQPDWSVLEFGCGTGSTAIAHAPYLGQMLATDLSDSMLAIAREKAAEASVQNLQFQQGTLDSLKLPEASFNAVLGLNILHLLSDVDTAIARVHDLLKPSGIFVSSTALTGEMHTLWRWLIRLMQVVGLAPHVCHLNKQDLLSRITQAGFAIEEQWQPERNSIFIIARKL